MSLLPLLQLALSLNAPSTKSSSHARARLVSRRQHLQTAAALIALPPLSAAADQCETDGAACELVIPQQTLLAGLASAPVRHVTVTGASSGVGLAGAKLLTAAGHKVTLACRTQAKADAAATACMEYAAGLSAAGPAGMPDFYAARRAGGSAVGAACDLSSLSSVRAFAASRKGEPLDTLVLNAGLSLNVGDPAEQFTADGYELTVGTNHIGHFALATLLQPTLSKSSLQPRLLVTASGVHDPASGGGRQGGPEKWASLGELKGLAGGRAFTMVDGGAYDPDKAYKDSKLCNMLFMAEAARRWGSGGITANAFSPGLIADPDGFFRNQNRLFGSVFSGISKAVGVAETNDFAGSALAYLAVDPAMDGQTGGWYDALPLGKHSLGKHAPSAEARDAAKAAKLWELSEGLLA
mmetsp:Transcript_6857/g.22639  ORF Transcript_6857/g.22639 Transcript_6857/m.22639 type:complete len:410 (+) Transcript_6857:54-1283(+)